MRATVLEGFIDGVARMEKSLNGGLAMLLHGDRDRDWNGLCTGCCAGAQASLFSCLSALRYPLMVEKWSHDCFCSFCFLGWILFCACCFFESIDDGALIHW